MRDDEILRAMVPAQRQIGCGCGNLILRGEKHIPDGPTCAQCVAEDLGLPPLPGSRREDR